MRVTHLSLTDFRSYANVDVELAPGVTTFVGLNGAGKTNLVEAVRYLSTLSSHRVAADAPLIRAGAERAVVRARVEKAGRALAMEVTITPGRANQARLNRGAVRPRELIGLLRTVVFAPEDLELVKGDPSARRRFMDELCVQLTPRLAGDISDYDRILRQRSSLLKTAKAGRADLSTLDIWDEKLAAVGATIVRARLDAIGALAPHVAAAYQEVAPLRADCVIRYQPGREADGGERPADAPPGDATEIAANLLARMRELRSKEIERGVCLVGPHRDDLEIRLGALPAKGYASHGESWSCALALRLGSYDLMTAEGGPDAGADGEPVLILDDVFAELDATRRDGLARRLASAHQVLVTAAVPADVPAALAGATMMVRDGEVVPHGGG